MKIGSLSGLKSKQPIDIQKFRDILVRPQVRDKEMARQILGVSTTLFLELFAEATKEYLATFSDDWMELLAPRELSNHALNANIAAASNVSAGSDPAARVA